MTYRQAEINMHPLPAFAEAWWQLVKSNCPDDWCRLLPVIDFNSPDRKHESSGLPVLQCLPRLAKRAPVNYRTILDRLLDAQTHLYFGQSYSAKDFGEAFLHQYGWVKLLGPDAYWHSDRISSGFLILGNQITYPLHWHEAEELYLPISGDAEWYREDQGWQSKPAGSLIHHASNIKHGTRTTGEPMIALYLWRGGDLVQKSDIQ